MSALPEGWRLAALDDLLAPQGDGRTVHQGWSPQCDKEPAGEDEWGALKTTAIQPGQFLPEHNKRLPSGKEPRPGLEVREGDVLLTCAGPRSRCGIACLVSETRPKLMISGKMYRFRFSPDHLHARYVALYLQSHAVWNAIDEMKTGVSDSGLNLTQGRIRTLPVPVPPLPEQRRIVAAIEEQLSRLDAAEASLDASLRRTRTLVQSLINSRMSGPPARLADLLEQPLRNGLSAKSSPTGRVRVLTLTAVTKNSFEDAYTKLIETPERSLDDLWLEPDDIFIQRSNTPELVGSAALYNGPRDWAIFPDLLIRIRLGPSALPGYVAMALKSPALRSYFRNSAQGIAGSMPKISQPIVESALVPLPGLDEQAAIVSQYAADTEQVDRMESETSSALRRLRSLRRSVLAAAFSGQLVRQNPSDEPASVLLERIAAKRAASKPSRRKKKAAS